MKQSGMARNVAAILTAVTALGAVTGAQAQAAGTIFPPGFDSHVRERLFMRLGYTNAFIKTKSEDTKDITGPVVSRADLVAAFTKGSEISADAACTAVPRQATCLTQFDDQAAGLIYNTAQGLLVTDALDVDGLNGLGTPAGIKAKTQKQAGTPTISLGYWLDDDYKWMIEAYVLAAPLSVKIYGDGVRADGTPNSLNGKHIVTTKLLPPIVIGSYSFGDKGWPVRPYVGVGAMYAMFFDARATQFFEDYVGGKTTITTKNAFGVGPFVGLQSPLDDRWHVNVSLGQVTLRATSKLVTSGTQINSGSMVLSDFPSNIVSAISDGEEAWTGNNPNLPGLTTTIMDLVKTYNIKGNNNSRDLGTYVREQKMKLTNTILTVSVGYHF